MEIRATTHRNGCDSCWLVFENVRTCWLWETDLSSIGMWVNVESFQNGEKNAAMAQEKPFEVVLTLHVRLVGEFAKNESPKAEVCKPPTPLFGGSPLVACDRRRTRLSKGVAATRVRGSFLFFPCPFLFSFSFHFSLFYVKKKILG